MIFLLCFSFFYILALIMADLAPDVAAVAPDVADLAPDVADVIAKIARIPEEYGFIFVKF